jgi:hypothetical protein
MSFLVIANLKGPGKRPNSRSSALAVAALVIAVATLSIHPDLHAQAHANAATNNQPTNVNVVNSPTVTLGGPITVLEPSRQPLVIHSYVQFPAGSDTISSDQYNIPAGKRLVLEQFSIHCNLDTPVYVDTYIQAGTASPPDYPAFFAPNVMSWPADGGSSSYRAVGTTPIHWMQDSQWIQFVVNKSNKLGGGQCVVTAAGYLTALPQ